MKLPEISFPRGNPSTTSSVGHVSPTGKVIKKRPVEGEHRKASRTEQEDDLFKVTNKSPLTTNKGKKRKKRTSLTMDEANLLASKNPGTKPAIIDTLSYQMISEGMLSLGKIVKIRKHEILVSLPGGTVGSVPITSISGPYTKALENLTVEEKMDEGPIYDVNDMFQIGQVVSVAVTEVKKENRSVRVTLSMSPTDVHSAYTSTSISESMVLTGAVSAVEDHGYIIDVGIERTHAFLPKQNAQQFLSRVNEGRPLGIGQLLKVKILKIKGGMTGGKPKSFLTLTINTKEIRKTRSTLETVHNYQLLLPGMESEGTIIETHATGVKVDFLDLVGKIHVDHMADAWILPTSLQVGVTIFPRVLYTMPHSTIPALTLQSSLLNPRLSVTKPSLALGAKVEVKVARIEKRGVIIKFQGGERGLVSSTRCSDDSCFTDEDIVKCFRIGSTHLCCVLEYSSLDNMYICSFQKSVLDQPVVRIEQLSLGQVVSCQLKAWKTGGAVVGVGLAKGFIPKLHFGELALKNPSLKFPVGHKFKARVCSIDLNNNQMVLTAKKRLVKSAFPILSTYEECTYGTTSEGIISKVTEFGLNIFTIGGLRAFIPASKVTTETRTRLTRLFFPGQVIQFRVVNANEKAHRIILSLLTEDSSADTSSSTVANKKETGEQGVAADDGIKQKSKKKCDVMIDGNALENKKKKKNDGTAESSKIKTKNTNMKPMSDENSSSKKIKTKRIANKGRQPEIDDVCVPPKKKKKVALDIPCLECPEESFYDNSCSKIEIVDSDSEIKIEESNAKAVKKKTGKEKLSEPEKIEENGDICSRDIGINSQNSKPVSVDDFERLVSATPNNSKPWIAYINFVLQGADIENARDIASRAIQTILFREEKEREKIWKFWLNMEVTHGTEESLKSTFNEALKANDPLTIYEAMITIYERLNKSKELDNIIYTMTKKFWEEKSAWCCALEHYYKTKNFEKGREIFNACLEKLPKADHITMISKVALLEMKNGNIENVRALLEKTLESYPKRLDLWILYTTHLIKYGYYDLAREVFGNAVRVTFAPRRMFTVLKNYLQFEIEHGTVENQEKVKEIALQYVNALPSAKSNLLGWCDEV